MCGSVRVGGDWWRESARRRVSDGEAENERKTLMATMDKLNARLNDCSHPSVKNSFSIFRKNKSHREIGGFRVKTFMLTLKKRVFANVNVF